MGIVRCIESVNGLNRISLWCDICFKSRRQTYLCVNMLHSISLLIHYGKRCRLLDGKERVLERSSRWLQRIEWDFVDHYATTWSNNRHHIGY